jgi:large subunit ribosomal protein L21
MQYAVISTGGKQYIAAPGKSLIIESLKQEVGDSITFDQVLLAVDGDSVTIGEPTIAGFTVGGTVVEQRRGEKLRIFKYRPKSRYSRTAGHRHLETVVRVDVIGDKKTVQPEKTAENATAKDKKPATRRKTGSKE